MELISAYAHYIAIFALSAFLVSEFVVLLLPVSDAGVRLLAGIDLWYGIVSVAVIGTGLARVFSFPDPSHFGTLPAFWVKMSIFAVVAILSIPPSIRFARWNKKARQGNGLPALAELASTRVIVILEMFLFACIPLAAVVMARS